MYINDFRWAGRLTSDARVLEPRKEGDRYLFTFCVAQTMPWRNRTAGTNEEKSQFINVAYRCSDRNASKLREKLVRGQYVLVDGELLIDHKDGPTGRTTYVTIDATKIQFPPVQYVNPKEPEQQAPEAPASAAQAHPDVFNPARFADDHE